MTPKEESKAGKRPPEAGDPAGPVDRSTAVPFSGPLFLIGTPRSGTKLLRDLLNNNSQVGIAPNESHFIPYYHKRLKRLGDLGDRARFDRFYRDVSKSTFYLRLAGDGLAPDPEQWYGVFQEICASGRDRADPAVMPECLYADALQALYLYIARRQGKQIWGDKTPSYMLHMPLLKKLFPGARFLHIVRDARDVCLSARRSMGKNLYRAAQRWHDHIRIARRDAAALPGPDYLEVSYETLVNVPERVLRRCCDFLQIPFEPEMRELRRPAENLGDARESTGILSGNSGKWRAELSKRQIRRIERIGGPLMAELGYTSLSRVKPQRLAGWRMALYKLADGLNLLRFHLRTKPAGEAVRFIRNGVRLSAKKGH